MTGEDPRPTCGAGEAVTLRHPLSRFFPAAPSPGAPGDPGQFGPGSAAWRIGRERALLAGGPAALLLQVAHPLVAAGVSQHSDFTGDPLRRLHGTLDAVLTVTFGDTAQVRGAVEAVGRRHEGVRGVLPDTTGGTPAGTPYRADDPELALWVFATLAWSAVTATEHFVRPLTPAERDAYYADMAQFGELFGAPASALPPGYAGLERYVGEQARDVLAVGPVALRLSRQILAPDPPIVAPPLRPLPALLAAGLLPPALRDAYGLPWRRRERASFSAIRRVARGTVAVLPPQARYWPHFLVAARRVSGR